MASRQLGRLRQWAEEVMTSRDSKMIVNEEFKDFEAEIELRKEGIERIQSTSEAYQRSLSKKKNHDALGTKEKLLPIDALGIIMIVHGEEFSEDSPLGDSLIKLGRAHCKVATLQEAYAVTFKDTFIASMQRFGDGIKEYERLQKQFESRRVAYEAALNKGEKLKQSKKEKEKLEAEEEIERAKERYDETTEEVRTSMEAIKAEDTSQLRELTAFLDLEINFAQQYLNVLKEVKLDWKQSDGQQKSLSRKSSGNVKSAIDPQKKQDHESSSDDAEPRTTSSGRLSFHLKGDPTGSKPPSRPTSRLSRKRTTSTTTVATDKSDKDEGKDKEATEKPPRRLSVAGWASSAVESVTNRGGKKNTKDKDSFAALDDEDESGGTGRKGSEWAETLKKSASFGSISRRSSKRSNKDPQGTPKITSQQEKKIVRARFDFQGKSTNELSFKAGDEIIVINEVLDSWWMGELHGRRGLFPTTYIEVVKPSKGRVPLPISRSDRHTPVGPPTPLLSDTHSIEDGYGSSELDEERDLTSRPMEHHSPFLEGLGDTQSVISHSTIDDEEHTRTAYTPRQEHQTLDLFAAPPSISEFPGTWSSSSSSFESIEPTLINTHPITRSTSSEVPQAPTPTKKAPPPPPPRRSAPNTPVIAPPLPERRMNMSGSSAVSQTSVTSSTSSFGSGSLTTTTHTTGSSGEGYDRSPFESTSDLAAVPLPRPSQSPAIREGSKETSGRTDPFRSGQKVR